MACIKRTETGTCTHDQCAWSDKTDHGYECVDIQDGYCENGSECYGGCEYSFPEDEEMEMKKAFANAYPDPEPCYCGCGKEAFSNYSGCHSRACAERAFMYGLRIR